MDKASTSSGCNEETSMQQLLPSVKDPKLWFVRCKRGSEQKLAVCMMRKFITKPAEVKICSVTALDHLKGYIYIEADKLANVKEACSGISEIYPEHTKLVPIEEMAETISVKVEEGFSQDAWVRMKSGIYKGDLAKVVDVDNVRQSVTVKLIPRIDLQVVSGKVKCGPGQKKAVLPPRLLNADEAREMHIRVERKQDPITGYCFEHIKGMKFKDGFLYKTVSANSIRNQNIRPTFDELQKFQQPGESGDGDASTKKGQFMEGDTVIIVEGDAKNSIVEVERVEEDILYVTLPEMQNIGGPVPVNVKDARKYFRVGLHVKVVSGATKGATGFVIKNNVDGLIILSDTMNKEMLVSPENIVESNDRASDGAQEYEVASGGAQEYEVASGEQKYDEYKLKDLVQLDKRKGFGVIVEVLGRQEIKVLKGLKETQEIVHTRLTEIKCKLQSKTTFDKCKKKILVNNVVRIVDGPCKGQQGSVVHIYKGILFIYNRYHNENAGIICAGSQSCEFVRGSCGGDSGASTSQHRVAESPRVLSGGGPPSAIIS